MYPYDTIDHADDLLILPDDITEPHLVLCDRRREPAVLSVNGRQCFFIWPQDTPDALLLATVEAFAHGGWPGLRIDSLSAESLRYVLTDPQYAGALIFRAAKIGNRTVVKSIELD